MVNYGLKNRVALITGANNSQGIGATTSLAFALVVAIAETILFLASKQARMLTGQVIKGSGGHAL